MKKLIAITTTFLSTLFGSGTMNENYDSYLQKFQTWNKSQSIDINEFTEIRSLYIKDCIQNLKTYYDNSPLHGIVIEINQNYSISVWVETVDSHRAIVKRFRSQSSGYEDKTDEEIYQSLTPWYYDSFKYSCLEFKCTKAVEPIADADHEFCETYEGDDLRKASHKATIQAILQLEKSGVIDLFETSKDFRVRVFSQNDDTISKGEYCWATDKLLIKKRKDI